MRAPVLHLALCRVARTPHQPPAPPPPPLEPIRAALARVERLTIPPPPPAKPMGKLLVLRIPVPSPTALPDTDSDWDPEDEEVELDDIKDEELALQTVNGCKTLLLEIIRRAAYDWVLYRGSRRMVQKVMAEQAYRWLFLENPG
jgi:hypothetical protein